MPWGWHSFTTGWDRLADQTEQAERQAGQISDEEWGQLSKQLGYDARRAYVDKVRQDLGAGNIAAGPPSPGMGGRGSPIQPIDAKTWVDQQKRAIYGEFAPVLDVYSSYYGSLTGKPIPSDLLAKLQAKLNDPNLPLDAKNSIRENMIAYMAPPPNAVPHPRTGVIQDPTKTQAYAEWEQKRANALKVLQDIPFLNTEVDAYLKAHPTVDQMQAKLDARITSAFETTLGRGPTADELKALKGYDDIALQRYIDNQPSHVKGLNYGMYRATVDRMTQDWQKYFHRAPTDKELLTGSGWTPEQQKDFIDNSPSSIKGVTIGRYKALDEFTSKIQSSLFPAGGLDPGFVDALNKATT